MRIGDQHHQHTFHFDIPTNRFWIHYGYKDRSSVQVRLEEDGQIYASVFPNEGTRGSASITLPFDIFVKKFHSFIKGLEDLVESPLGQLAMQADDEH